MTPPLLPACLSLLLFSEALLMQDKSGPHIVFVGRIERSTSYTSNKASPVYARGDMERPRIQILAASLTRECEENWLITKYDPRTRTYQNENVKPMDGLCRIEVPEGTRHVRVEISVPGHKKYSINVPDLEYDNTKTAQVNIGVVQLMSAELPTVQQVILGREDNGSFRFR